MHIFYALLGRWAMGLDYLWCKLKAPVILIPPKRSAGGRRTPQRFAVRPVEDSAGAGQNAGYLLFKILIPNDQGVCHIKVIGLTLGLFNIDVPAVVVQ